ncbi:hypothetical protein ACFC53_13825 [Enterococcus casseliflavus]|uniref:hypothetical protein n=1 Tax=Enterococcus casseliflavus TaxID=37734 RepID=UPI0035D663AE
MHDYVADYINAVDSGEIIVGKKIQQAIDRHKRDLEKSKSDDFPYEFDLEKTRLVVGLFFRIYKRNEYQKPYKYIDENIEKRLVIF